MPESVATLLEHLRDALRAIEQGTAGPARVSWADLMEPMERISESLGRAWGLVGHLQNVRDSPALRDAVKVAEPGVVKLGLELQQSQPV